MGHTNSTSDTPSKLPATMELPTLLTKVEVADYFGVSIRTVDEWRAHNRGPAPIKIGKHLRWTVSSIVEFIQQQAQDVV